METTEFSVEALFAEETSTPPVEEEVKADASQEEEDESVSDETDDSVEEEAESSEEEMEAKEETEEEVNWEVKAQEAEKRRKDTEKWAQENNRQLKFLMDKIANGEEIDEATLSNLAQLSQEAQADPLAEVKDNFVKAYPLVKGVYTARGDDPDLFLEAFDNAASIEAREKLLTLKPEEQVPFILEEGRKLSESYSFLKKHGSLEAAFEAAKAEAVAKFAEENKTPLPKKKEEKVKLRSVTHEDAGKSGKTNKEFFDSMFSQ